MLVDRICKICGEEFTTNLTPSRAAAGAGIYCSKTCAAKSRVGEKATANKGGQIRKCKVCKKEFKCTPSRIAKGFGDYCSRSCAAKSLKGVKGRNWRGGMVTLKCQHCGKTKEITKAQMRRGAKFCSVACKVSHQSKVSKVELRLKAAFDKRGMKYETQKYFKFGKIATSADFFFKENMVVVYVDGIYWHNKPGIPARDALINRALEKHGYRVIRFTDNEINNHLVKCVNIVENIVNN